MNALFRNDWTNAWAAIGREIPRPRAVLCISAHWYVPFVAVTAMERPETIHDFGGFPRELFEFQYPAPGSPELASDIAELLAPQTVALSRDWGLDHGTWAVLCHVFPGADIPVVQLSIDSSKPARFHYDLAQRLAPLRDEGVFICGSGDIVHNLRMFNWRDPQMPASDWGLRFENDVRRLIETGDHEPLIAYESLGDDAMLSVPTPEHYLPLLYILALQRDDEAASFPVEGFEGGSISMLSVRIG